MSASAAPSRAPAPNLAALPIDVLLQRLGTARAAGLTEADARRRLAVYGPNEPTSPPSHSIRGLLAKFWGLSAWLLELIMLLSFVQRRWAELAIVGVLLVVNALLAFALEQRAAGVVDALRRRLQITARVRRDGRWQTLTARELVPGDIVRLRPGDLTPADVRLLDGALVVDQSALTGESADIDKATGDMVPSGSRIHEGEGDAVVLFTGSATFFGRTVQLVELARPTLHVEQVVARVVGWLFAIVGVLVALVFALSTVRHIPVTELLPLALVLLVSAVPVALPVMFTVTMALGSEELAKRGVLVTRLSASEHAATMDVLCVDKTGTITANALSLVQVIPGPGHTAEDVLLAGARASEEANRDPIDLAVIRAARAQRLLDGTPSAVVRRFVPFDPIRRRTEAVVDVAGATIVVMKGAVREVARACGLPDAERESIEQRAHDAAASGGRVLAVASGSVSGAAMLLGLIVLRDAPRPDARVLVDALRALGVRVLMLTGDAVAVARAVGAEVGLARIAPVAELKAAAARGAEHGAAAVMAGDGYAEVYPEDKYTVVRALQDAGHVVGMTGDGVNDAPALRQAEVGIAVAAATDAAKGAASVVLTEAGLTNIVTLVEQARVMYQRILTWIINKVSRTLLQATFVAVAFLATGRFVISALGMLLLVFMTDFAKIALATDRVRGSRHPETWNLREYVTLGVTLGALMVVETLAALAVGWSRFGLVSSPQRLQTFSFQLLLFFSVFSIVSARERNWFWTSRPGWLLSVALGAAVASGLALPRAGHALLAPIPWMQSMALLLYAVVACLSVNDIVKVVMLRHGAAARPAPAPAPRPHDAGINEQPSASKRNTRAA